MEYTIRDMKIFYPDAFDELNDTRSGILPMVLYKLFGPKYIQLNILKSNNIDDAITKTDNRITLSYRPDWLVDETVENLKIKGFTNNESLERYFRQVYGMDIKCMTSTEKRKSFLIFTDSLKFQQNIIDNYEVYKMLPALIPWEYENNQTHISPEKSAELENLIIGLLDLKNEVYIREDTELGRMLRDKAIGKEIEKVKLSNFATKVAENERCNLATNLSYISSDIDSTLEKIKELRKRYKETNEKLIAAKFGGGESEKAINTMMSFITNSNKITVHRINEAQSEITIRVKTYLSSWDEDTIQILIDNKNSYLYGDWYTRNYMKEAEKFWTELFVNETFRLPMQAMYQINPMDEYVNVDQTDVMFKEKDKKICPNPHLYYYQCLGSIEESFENAFGEGDLVKIPILCTVSAGSVHTEEEPVMQRFVNHLFENEYVVEFNGEEIDAKEFLINIFNYYPED